MKHHPSSPAGSRGSRRLPFALAAVGILAGAWAAPAWSGGEIYGTISTKDGESFTGPIRWDKNENYWDDLLDAQKDREVEGKKVRQEVRIFGLQISRSGGRTKTRGELTVPFGHLRTIAPNSRNRVLFELKNGETIEARTSSDIGDGMRGIEIEDGVRGVVELDWDSVERIDFAANPGPGRDEQRLYGTLETRKARFTGFIVWDRDESMIDDVLDGEENGRKYKIPFARITAIDRAGSDAARIHLDEGRAVELSGTNDVNDEIRGIAVLIPGVGTVEVDWDEFRRLELQAAPPSRTYDQFDGGRRLRGTVVTKSGERVNGEFLWDDDEEFTWEPLDGDMIGVDIAIQFENIASIRRISRDACEVRLINGDVFELSGSNDVDDENRGIRMKLGGEERLIPWEEFESVELSPAG